MDASPSFLFLIEFSRIKNPATRNDFHPVRSLLIITLLPTFVQVELLTGFIKESITNPLVNLE